MKYIILTLAVMVNSIQMAVALPGVSIKFCVDQTEAIDHELRFTVSATQYIDVAMGNYNPTVYRWTISIPQGKTGMFCDDGNGYVIKRNSIHSAVTFKYTAATEADRPHYDKSVTVEFPEDNYIKIRNEPAHTEAFTICPSSYQCGYHESYVREIKNKNKKDIYDIQHIHYNPTEN